MSGERTVRIRADRLQVFEPKRLGALSPTFRSVLPAIANRRQSEIVSILEAEVAAVSADGEGVETEALRVSLLVLRDYVIAGNYPIITGGRCFLAGVTESESLSGDQQRTILRHQYEGARDRALRDRGQMAWLREVARALGPNGYSAHQAVAALASGPPELSVLDARENRQGLDARGLWRCVRVTWSMGPEASAPGREVAFLVSDRRWPATPLGILQFRNVVPQIRARDLWLGVSCGSVAESSGFLGLLGSEGQHESRRRARATLGLLRSLLEHVQIEGLGVELEAQRISDLGELARSHRLLFDATRGSDGHQGIQNEHLKVVKRAQTAQDLLRGIRSLEAIATDAVSLDALPVELIEDLEAGLSKIWHYHMGFAALEMSICGAAPPFGPLRTGKLMAALAGSREVIGQWGSDRPLGAIAQEVYRPTVRDVVPTAPVVVFTSGLFPGHSAQYNRVRSGQGAWRKIGDTTGYGSFHISFESTEAMRRLNEFVDGYEHVTRTFGEGSGARFRSVGRALSYLGLPDLRKHEIRRPLYALDLVDNPQHVLLGWEEPIRRTLPDAASLGDAWWNRWVAPSAKALVARAQAAPDLESVIFRLLSTSEAAARPSENLQPTLR